MLAHRLLGGGSSSLSIACPSLGSALIVATRAVSGAPLSSAVNLLSSRTRKQRGEKKSLASSAAADFFPVFPPSQLWGANPFRLCSRRQPQSSPCDPSLSSQPRPPRCVSRQASRAAECCSAASLCAGISPFFPLRPCCCGIRADSRGLRLSLEFV